LASEASAADLDAAVAFYSSPTGQRILSASVKAAKKLSTTSQIASPQKEAADLAYRESLRTLVAKYRLDPK
jgi:hypothetical protein